MHKLLKSSSFDADFKKHDNRVFGLQSFDSKFVFINQMHSNILNFSSKQPK